VEPEVENIVHKQDFFFLKKKKKKKKRKEMAYIRVNVDPLN
jgi:hypothetical protein